MLYRNGISDQISIDFSAENGHKLEKPIATHYLQSLNSRLKNKMATIYFVQSMLPPFALILNLPDIDKINICTNALLKYLADKCDGCRIKVHGICSLIMDDGFLESLQEGEDLHLTITVMPILSTSNSICCWIQGSQEYFLLQVAMVLLLRCQFVLLWYQIPW